MRYMFMRFPEGKAKAVTFSYDDGSKADLRLADILDKNGLKGTFNVMSGMQDQRSTTDAERLDLMERGHEIALHGDIHRAPCLSRPIDTIRDTLDCRLELEKRYGRIIRGYAYPDSGIGRFINGLDYSVIRNQLSVMGVAYARTLGGDNGDFLIPNDPYGCPPPTTTIPPSAAGSTASFPLISKTPTQVRNSLGSSISGVIPRNLTATETGLLSRIMPRVSDELRTSGRRPTSRSSTI